MATITETVTSSNSHRTLHVPGLATGPYGQRLCVNVVDELAQKTPDRIYATVTNSPTDINDGFRDITVKEFSNAVNYAAWDIRRRFGVSEKFDVIAYIGVSDLRYAIYLYGAIKTGHQLMIPSVRNSESQHLSVFEAAKCSRVLHTPSFSSTINRIRELKSGLRAFVVPELDQLIEIQCAHYEYKRSWAEARTDPIIIAHSSGSTGNPKPTTITHGVYSTYDNHRKIPHIPGRKIQGYTLLDFPGGGKFYNPYPPFHLAGLFAMTIMPTFYNCTVTTGPPDKPPSGELLSQAMSKLKIRAAWCPPTVIEQLLEQPGGFEQASALDWIMYTGGPLAQAAGDRLSKVTDVCQMYGSTETGPHVSLVPLPENWAYFEWHPLLENTMEPMGDGTYEMVVYKDPSLDWVRHLSQAYPHLDVWRTNDLFTQHPQNSKLWKFAGRRDDVLVLSNGEKFNPVNMEGAIVGHELVRGALIVGTGRFQASLIVEPRPELDLSTEQFIDNIWPVVQHANTLGPAHGRIFRHKITVAPPEKAFIRAGKGTVIRGRTTKLFEEEVERLYVEENISTGMQVSSIEEQQTVTDCVRSCVAHMVSETFNDNDDLFVLGMDSLQTLELTKSLNRAFSPYLEKLEAGPLPAGMIYTHPSISQLGPHLHRVLNGLEPLNKATVADRTVLMNHLIDKYSANLDSGSRQSNTADRSDKLCVAVTGSTGSLGQQLLQVLFRDPNVSRIYCLNRAADARARHLSAICSLGLNYDLDSKVTFLTTNFDDARFGLSTTDYETLRQNLDAIIHNAWKVNFNHELASFEDVHIRGVRHLIDFSRVSDRQTHVFFVSSLSSVGNWPVAHGSNTPVPEIAMTDSNTAMQLGYGESKHVAERVLHNAVEQANIKATVLRVGQLAGPLAEKGGVWNRTEWFPNLMKTSKALGMIPNAMNTIDWIPVDAMANIISELVQTSSADGSSMVYNLANPTAAQWSDLLPAVREAWGDGIKIVEFKEWLDAIATQDDTEKFPALKILDFYTGLAQETRVLAQERINYEVKRAAEHSPTMRDLQPINKEAMATWLKQWSF